MSACESASAERALDHTKSCQSSRALENNATPSCKRGLQPIPTTSKHLSILQNQERHGNAPGALNLKHPSEQRREHPEAIISNLACGLVYTGSGRGLTCQIPTGPALVKRVFDSRDWVPSWTVGQMSFVLSGPHLVKLVGKPRPRSTPRPNSTSPWSGPFCTPVIPLELPNSLFYGLCITYSMHACGNRKLKQR